MTTLALWVHELLVLAGQAHKMAAVPVSFVQCARRQSLWKLRLRTIAMQPAWMIQIMEAETSGLADQVLRVQQQAARKSWRAWLDENTTGGAAKVHQLIRQPIGFQAARGNAVDEQLKLRETWAAIWQANTLGPALAWPEDNGPLFHRPSTDAMRRVPSFRAVTGLVYDAVPPRALNELPDQGIEALIDLIMLIEQTCEWSNQCNRIVFIVKVCDPSGSSLPAYACSASFVASRPRCWRPRMKKFFSGPRWRVASSGVSGSRHHGLNGQQRTELRWQPSSVTC